MEMIKQLCVPSQLRLKSTQMFIVAGTVLLTLLITLLCIGLTIRYEVDHEVANVADMNYWKDKVSVEQQLWYEKGIEELNVALATYETPGYPRNVIIVLVNGIDAQQLAAARFPSSSSSAGHESFAWDQFPHLARLSSSCRASDRCDAGSMATALWSGVRGNLQTVGMDATVPFGHCSSAARNASHQLKSVLRQAQLAGLRTGFVTTQRISGPTGAALYAHVPDSSWECDAHMPRSAIEAGCEDVALQLLSSSTGRHLNVVLGGGQQLLSSKVATPAWNELDESVCHAADGRNLLRDWRRQKLKMDGQFELVQQASELEAINGSRLDYLLGTLANGDLADNAQAPTLQLMLSKALAVLQRRSQGYLLFVEQFVKRSDRQLEQLQLLNETVAILMKEEQTLTLVLFTKGNYLSYGLDMSDETELFSNLDEAFEDESLLQRRLQQMLSESLVFAAGPKSSLFHGVRDETYLAHALAFALRMGVFSQIEST